MKNGETENGNIVECIYRRYRVQLPGGTTIEVESTKPLSRQTTHVLLDEDSEIGSFFENHKIINVVNVENRPKKPVYRQKTIRTKRPEVSISPLDRLNHMLQMPDKFTRLDYQKYMRTEYKIKLSDFIGHNDIETALALNKLEAVGRFHRLRQYRVIDQTVINKEQYRSLLKDQRK